MVDILPEETAVTTTTTTTTTDPSKNGEAIGVELDIGELVRQGGFHAWFELKSVRGVDVDHSKWILEPVVSQCNGKSPNKSTQTNDHRRNSSSFGGSSSSLGNLGSSILPGSGHRRKNSSKTFGGGGRGMKEVLPPNVKSTTIQILAPFEKSGKEEEEVNSPKFLSPKSRKGSFLGGHHRRNSSSTSSLGSIDLGKILAGDSSDQNNNNNNSVRPQYVIKCLSTATMKDDFLLEQGAKDMQIEAEVMRKLSHPRLKAIGTMTLLEGENESLKAEALKEYPLLILDRLSTTLDLKLEQWRAKQQKLLMAGKFATSRRRLKSWQFFQERLACVIDTCNALNYLHTKEIIYRNIKDENIGIDQTGKVQLMNFGLAKDVSDLERTRDGLYRLTGVTGNVRYMAPENATEKPYNEKCDVYSFGLLTWQVMSLKTPFAKYNVKKMYQLVFKAPHARPSLKQDFQEPYAHWIQPLLENMWSPDINERYSMDQVFKILRAQQEEWNQGN